MKCDLSISICVPAFNEKDSLVDAVEDLISVLGPAIRDLEIIVVDDASTDNTKKIADKLAGDNPCVRVMHNVVNSGLGFCYKRALGEAKNDYFTWFPGDHENSADEFIPCLTYLKENVVVTSHHEGYDSRSFLRRFLSKAYVWILNKFFKLNLKYYNGLALFPSELLRSFNLFSNGFVLPSESIIRAVNKGCQIVELAAPLKKRNEGESKALSFVSIARVFKDIILIFSDGKIRL